MRVLVVEDEVRLAENIAKGLREGPGYAEAFCVSVTDRSRWRSTLSGCLLGRRDFYSFTNASAPASATA